MKTKLKIEIDKSETSNFQISVKDITGQENIVNRYGYGVLNSFSPSDVSKYVFIITNLVSEEEHKYVFVEGEENSAYSPKRISLGEGVLLYPKNNCEKFDDGIYRIDAYSISQIYFEGHFYPKTEVITNFSSAEHFANHFDGLIVENNTDNIYLLDSAVDDVLTLDKHVGDTFGNKKFYGLLECSTEFIIDSSIQELMFNKIGDMVIEDSCNKELVSNLSEVNLYLWASRTLYKKGDVRGSFEYLNLANNLLRICNSC